MEVLREPSNSGVLGPLKRLLGLWVLGVAPDRESVGDAREILVVILETERRDLGVCIVL